MLKLRECAHEAYSLFQQGRWVAPLHEEEPPGLGTSKAVTRYAHRQRTPHSGRSAYSGSSPANSGDGANAESNSEYKYENVQTALEEYIRSWSASTASSSGHAPNGGPITSPQANAPIQPPTSDAFLHGVLTGNWEMPSEETVWSQVFTPNRTFSSTTGNLPNAPPTGTYDLPSAENLMEDIAFGGAAPTTGPPSIPQNRPMTYSSPPIVQQQPQLETQAPRAQQAAVDAFNRPYGAPLTGGGDASTNFTHQEAIYNAGIWGDLMTNFGLNQ